MINPVSTSMDAEEESPEEFGIVPTTIRKEVRPPIHNAEDESDMLESKMGKASRGELAKMAVEIEKQMKAAAKQYDFEKAAKLRDILFEIRAEMEN